MRPRENTFAHPRGVLVRYDLLVNTAARRGWWCGDDDDLFGRRARYANRPFTHINATALLTAGIRTVEMHPYIGYIYEAMRPMEFTAAEASWVTGLSVKAVNKAIEDCAVPVRTLRVGKLRRRYVPYNSLICLQLHAEGLGQLPLRIRRDVFRRVLTQPRQKRLKYTEALIIDVGGARVKLINKLQELRKATRVIVSDPEIMGGTPVFRETRVPVYLVADMMEQGTPVEEILDGYPSLTRDMVEHARIYAEAHPKRGRPPVQPWSGTKPKGRKRGKLRRVA